MSRIAWYFASGESLYPGVALLLSAVIAGMFLKKKLMQQALNLLAWIAFVFIVMACPPFSLLVDFISLLLLRFGSSPHSELRRRNCPYDGTVLRRSS